MQQQQYNNNTFEMVPLPSASNMLKASLRSCRDSSEATMRFIIRQNLPSARYSRDIAEMRIVKSDDALHHEAKPAVGEI